MTDAAGQLEPVQFTGTNPDRQAVGLPGHCDDCATRGHVAAHPDLGCGDVGCHDQHPESADPPVSVGKLVQHDGGHLGLTADGTVTVAVTCAVCGNGYRTALALDAHPCTGPQADLDELEATWRGVFVDGYTDVDVQDLDDALRSVDIACVWRTYGRFDFAGDSELAIRDVHVDGTRGSWRWLSAGLTAHLAGTDDADLESTWLGDPDVPDLTALPVRICANYATSVDAS